MLIIGEEAPFIESPDPEFGEVIGKLNEITFLVQANVESFNESSRNSLDRLRTKLNDFIIGSITPIDDHLALRGAVHGETKATIGLSKKDNYRTATTLEARTYAPVNAFVTPEGVKAAFQDNINLGNLADFQRNGVFQFASFYHPDEYSIATINAPEPVRYLAGSMHVPMLINSDRLIYAPKSLAGRYTTQVIFTGLPLDVGTKNRLGEVTGLSASYQGANWNSNAALTTDGKVCFFRPLADKKIYNYKTSLGLPAGNQSYLLYDTLPTPAYRGLGVSTVATATRLTINHRFFYASNQDVDPILLALIGPTYVASIDQMGKAPAVAPLNGNHYYNFNDFVSFPTGTTVRLDTEALGPVNTLVWVQTDHEILLNVSVPLVATLGDIVKKFYLSINESIIPGTLETGGAGTITTMGSRNKDVLNDQLDLVEGATFLKVSSLLDLNNPTQFPGVVLNNGLLVKAIGTKYGMRVKRYSTLLSGIKEWIQMDKPFVHVGESTTEMFAPARHAPFGVLPERIIPFNHTADQTQYFVYGLSTASGKFEWSNITWQSSDIVGGVTGDVFGVRSPDVVETNKELGDMPFSVVVRANKATGGVTIDAMAFTTGNDFKGHSSFSYVNKTLTLGSQMTISFTSFLPVQNAMNGVMERAKVANPAQNNDLRQVYTCVFMVSPSKALVVISDGLGYAEAAVVGYNIILKTVELTYPAAGLKTVPVTPAGVLASGTYRSSLSSDGVWMASSDLLVSQKSLSSYDFVLTRPFGDVYGDLSFSVDSFETTPVFTMARANPARLYSGLVQIDAVEEMYPAILIPNKGVYQNISPVMGNDTVLKEVGGVQTVDPFVVNESGWVRMPSGSRLMLNGKSYVINQDFALKVNPTGTTYCYMRRVGETLVAVASTTRREVANNEILFGTATNGVLTLTKSYIVLNNHVLSSARCGSAIPCFDDNGANGLNKFFTRRDVL